jgi:hypothetical protein
VQFYLYMGAVVCLFAAVIVMIKISQVGYKRTRAMAEGSLPDFLGRPPAQEEAPVPGVPVIDPAFRLSAARR